MRSHEHAAVSVAYGVLVAGAARHSLADPAIYVATLLGGEIVDALDHPLYHLVYGRRERAVVEVREELRRSGIRAAWRLAGRYEDERRFDGLALHQVPFLLLVAAVCVLVAFAGAGLFVCLALGALLLHLTCDLVGDVVSVGHARNWVRSMPARVVRFSRSTPERACGAVAALALFVLAALTAISIAAGTASTHHSGLAALLTPASRWLPYAPAVLATGYLLLMAVASWLTVEVYRARVAEPHRKAPLPASGGSVARLRGLAGGRIARTSRELERLLLTIQADQLQWSLIVGAALAAALTILDLLGVLSSFVLLLTPIVVAIALNTFVHSTIGELGSSSGVVLALCLNTVLARLHVVDPWGQERVLVAGIAAVGAMVLALAGGILLRGRVRMSAVCFCAHLTPGPGPAGPAPAFAQLAATCLADGYRQARVQLDARGIRSQAASVVLPEALYGEQAGNLRLTNAEVCAARISDRYSPIVREVASYMVRGASGAGHATPILPRHRVVVTPGAAVPEIVCTAGTYRWSDQGPIGAHALPCVAGDGADGATKSYSEFLDNLITLSSEIVTDVFVAADPERAGAVIVWGITREATSTKEYATIEAELYAASVVAALHTGGCVVAASSLGRVTFTRASIYDLDVVDAGERATVFGGQLSKPQHAVVARYADALERTTTGAITTTVAAGVRRKLVVFALQIAIGTTLAALGLAKV